MFERFLGRDRLILTGLIVLGLLMAAAGVVSGRSTFDYVLSLDARNAAEHWVRQAESNERANAGQDKPGIGFGGGIMAEIDKLLGGGGDAGQQDHVSRVSGIALLDRDKRLLMVSGAKSQRKLALYRELPSFDQSFDAALRSGHAQVVRARGIADEGGRNHNRLVLVPVVANSRVERVYMIEADQRSAESMTEVALTAVSVVTSLLIVMGFVVPAAIATRRIRERWLAEDKIRFLALHDALTGLPNRVQLRERLEHAAARAKRRARTMAVLCLDLDRFKHINDTLGHAAGDALLKEVAARLLDAVREVDTVARLGGDEFAVIAEDLESPEDATRLARRICEALAKPYAVNGHEFTTTSIGIALGPVDDLSGDTLLVNADLALYRAKHDGRNNFRFFEPEMDAALQKRRKIEHDLRQALMNNQLEVKYQPQYDLQSGRLTGYEALTRWQHPVDGEIAPSVFIPIAEDTGLIVGIGEWVMRTACSYAATWPEHIRLAVNLSAAQFKAQDIVTVIARILEETGFPARRLELEITESLLLQNTDKVLKVLKRLDELGVCIAMDDFGTGYSSLSYLTRFPVRKIKIDRSFIDTLGTEPETTAIVSSIVGLGQSLNVTITAEGVETPGQADILRRWGCDQVQGFFYGQPDATIAEQDGSAPSSERQVA